MAWRGPKPGQVELHSYFEILKGTNDVPFRGIYGVPR